MKNRGTLSVVQFTLAFAWAGVIAAPSAIAQSGPPPAGDDEWRFSVGVGVFYRPKYPGSSQDKIAAAPMASVAYGRFFLGGTPGAGLPFGVGAYLVQNETWKLGVAVGQQLGKPREESDAPLLNGWGDISATALGGVFGSYSYEWLTLKGAVVSDIAGKGQGTRVALDLEAKYSPMKNLILTAGPGVTWGSKDYLQTFFGINAQQSAIAGVPQYSVGSGIVSVNFNVGAMYRVDAHWNVGARVNGAWLQGDAGSSPVTERKSQPGYGFFVNYQF